MLMGIGAMLGSESVERSFWEDMAWVRLFSTNSSLPGGDDLRPPPVRGNDTLPADLRGAVFQLSLVDLSTNE